MKVSTLFGWVVLFCVYMAESAHIESGVFSSVHVFWLIVGFVTALISAIASEAGA